MGQCGLGNIRSPVLQPTKVSNLDNVPVYQVTNNSKYSPAELETAEPGLESALHTCVVTLMSVSGCDRCQQVHHTV